MRDLTTEFCRIRMWERWEIQKCGKGVSGTVMGKKQSLEFEGVSLCMLQGNQGR